MRFHGKEAFCQALVCVALWIVAHSCILLKPHGEIGHFRRFYFFIPKILKCFQNISKKTLAPLKFPTQKL